MKAPFTIWAVKMEVNRDESERCILLAKRFISEGNTSKAERFLQKAEKLFPSQQAKDLLNSLHTMNGSAGSHTADNDIRNRRNRSGSRNRSKAANHGSHSDHEGESYTQEQLHTVKRIRKCKDYYEILGLSKDCSDADLKKAYRKLALQNHPDKNKAPGATEAFKAIGNAFAVISDPEKRRRYDLYGAEDNVATTSRRTHSRHPEYEFDFSRGFEGDISAEELFNMFFGGGFPTGNVHTYSRRNTHTRHHTHHNHNHQQQQSAETVSVMIQLMPILLLVCLTLVSSYFAADPIYSLRRDGKFIQERKTQNLGVFYYVKDSFTKDYNTLSLLKKVEQNVESDYVDSLRTNCYKERNYRETLLWRARSFGDAKMYEKAKKYATASCDKLTYLYGA
ncbi:PREDICTED: dnaJ homolog subfamily B member 12-like [Priapulus caudatus]|uniref:DnaJ homolog subfamily B member 12-like n=1 Tax=Priapulus caudatus TaxID=37621 RepID=A0ABM1EC05_PRICU|nr:PREDICTED: dnaJ homolog subfamily B member 12-like [Priapulus caudatus]XP_014669727.1 PREDICTED: dnaJ homolog subfamily B member 12-like [Priapulus caudatus]